MLYSDRKDLLDLYNAVSGKHYEDPELLEINTLENAIYMSMHNDLSFLIDSRLSLYEHQSTYSLCIAYCCLLQNHIRHVFHFFFDLFYQFLSGFLRHHL